MAFNHSFADAALRVQARKIQAQIDGLQAALTEKYGYVDLAQKALMGDVIAQEALVAAHKQELQTIEILLINLINRAAKLGLNEVVSLYPTHQKCTASHSVEDLELRCYRTHAKHLWDRTANIAIHGEKRGVRYQRVVQLTPLQINQPKNGRL